MGRSPGVQAALERLGLEAELAELQRRTGAGLLARSGAVQDKGLVAKAVGRPLGNLVGQDPDAAGDADAVAVVLRAAADIQDKRWAWPGQAFGHLVISGDSGRPVTVWLAQEALSQTAESRTTRHLTETECHRYVPEDLECDGS